MLKQKCHDLWPSWGLCVPFILLVDSGASFFCDKHVSYDQAKRNILFKNPHLLSVRVLLWAPLIAVLC